jgi:hypothetical protein
MLLAGLAGKVHLQGRHTNTVTIRQAGVAAMYDGGGGGEDMSRTLLKAQWCAGKLSIRA